MSDSLEKVFREAQGWEPPPGHVEAVRRRGRNVKRTRIAGFAAVALLVVGAASVATLYLTGTYEQERLQYALPPQEQPDDMIPKAARFAFHALLEAGPYELDYKGTERFDEGWVATFVSGPTVGELRTRVQIAKETLEEFRANVQRLKNKIAGNERLATVGAAEAKAEKELRQMVRELQMALRFSLPAAKRDVKRFSTQLQETLEGDGPRVTEIEVSEKDGVFEVARLTGPYDQTQRSAIESFRERVPQRLIGYEFFDVKLIGKEGDRSWSGRGFYVGEVPSPERVRCGVRLFDAENRLVAKSAQDDYIEMDAASDEDGRDGLAFGAGIKLLVAGPPPALSHTAKTDCRLVSGNWEVVGEVTFRPVVEGERQSHSAYKLDPARHVMVEAELEYEGDPTSGEHICIAKAFDEGGVLIDSHGLTLYPSEIERSGAGNHVAIAVDVGDPSRAASATIECQPVIPGVPLGLDQD